MAVNGAVVGSSAITAGYRAIETAQSDSILQDPLAAVLGGAEWIQRLNQTTKDIQNGQLLDYDRQHKRVAHWIVARSRFFDDQILGALAVMLSASSQPCQGALPQISHAIQAQVVMLGAGLDSRPWRLLLPPGVAWFEVDMPACIAIKQSRLHQIGAGMSHTDEPDTKSFPLKAATWSAVGADATDPCLIELLGAVGFDPSVPTVFVCEGLWYYLSPDKLDEMLQLLARSSPVGSTILADAMDDKFMQHNRKQARELYAAKMKFAPPVIDSMKSTYPWDCTDRLAKAGWTLEAATDARGWAKACGRTPAADLIYTVQTLPTSLQSDSMPASPPTKNGHLFTVRAARY